MSRLLRLLSGSGIFLAEDLSREDRKKRKVQVREMKKARNEGKKAYIRYIDGELIIDGKVYEVDAEGTNPPLLFLPQLGIMPLTRCRTEARVC